MNGALHRYSFLFQENISQIVAGEAVHYEIGFFVDNTEVVNSNYVWMIQDAGGFGFELKSSKRQLVSLTYEQFYCNNSVHEFMASFVNNAHAALAKYGE